MKRRIKNLLYRSLDNDLDQTDQRELNHALADSAGLRQEKEFIGAVREKIRLKAQYNFPADFVGRVMLHIRGNHHEEELFFESLFRVFRPLAAAALFILFVLVIYNLYESDHSSLDGIYTMNDVSVEEAFDPLVDLTTE